MNDESWNETPYSMTEIFPAFATESAASISGVPWSRRQQVNLKYRFISTRLYGAISQKHIIFIISLRENPKSHTVIFMVFQHFLQRGSLNRADFMPDACALQKVEVVVMALDGNMKQCALAVQVWLVQLRGLARTPRHVGHTPAAFRHLGEYSLFGSL